MADTATESDRARVRSTMEKHGVPERFRGGLERYALDRIEPGSLLRCVLENDLLGALSRADECVTLDDLRALVLWRHWELEPGTAAGSGDAVRSWLAREEG